MIVFFANVYNSLPAGGRHFFLPHFWKEPKVCPNLNRANSPQLEKAGGGGRSRSEKDGWGSLRVQYGIGGKFFGERGRLISFGAHGVI